MKKFFRFQLCCICLLVLIVSACKVKRPDSVISESEMEHIDNFTIETTRLAQRQLKFIQGLQAALVRIENKTYGICRETGKLIPAERLRAVPHATLSIEAKNSGKK